MSRQRLTNGLKKEILRAISYYILKILGKRSRKSYIHRRIYQIIRQFLSRRIR
jgi:hypothetical protein